MEIKMNVELKQVELSAGDVVSIETWGVSEYYLVSQALNKDGEAVDGKFMLRNLNGSSWFGKVGIGTLQELSNALNGRRYQVYSKKQFRLVLEEK